ncbi:hypothetical protein CPB85DRAFT_1256413 [Mucidula mucida]|nr:hypothetical protein CPB85DRAFT_1256413 [Mucidula mucida]
MSFCVRHIDETTAQNALLLVILILGVLLGCISIATVVLYCLRRSQKRRARRDDLVIPMKFMKDNNDAVRSIPNDTVSRYLRITGLNERDQWWAEDKAQELTSHSSSTDASQQQLSTPTIGCLRGCVLTSVGNGRTAAHTATAQGNASPQRWQHHQRGEGDRPPLATAIPTRSRRERWVSFPNTTNRMSLSEDMVPEGLKYTVSMYKTERKRGVNIVINWAGKEGNHRISGTPRDCKIIRRIVVCPHPPYSSLNARLTTVKGQQEYRRPREQAGHRGQKVDKYHKGYTWFSRVSAGKDIAENEPTIEKCGDDDKHA